MKLSLKLPATFAAADATAEQSAGVSQVGVALAQMDHATQQADQLVGALGSFKLAPQAALA